MARASTKPDRNDLLRQLHGQLDAVDRTLDAQGDGWDASAFTSLVADLRALQAASTKTVPEWAAPLDGVLQALEPIGSAVQRPDGDALSRLAAALDAVRNAVPPPDGGGTSPGRQAADGQRAEYPPPQYWRRWAGDAPPAAMPVADAPKPAAATARAAKAAKPAIVPETASTPAPAQETDTPYRVLIVEDDPSQALFAESVLVGSGMAARLVMSGEEVMDAMADFQPELVLMDLHMPGVSGTDLTTMIRSQHAYNLIPIVFLTGDPDPEKQYEVLELGADDFLSKPIRPRHLIAAVQNRVKRVRAAQAGTPAPLGEAGGPAHGLTTRTAMLEAIGRAIAARQTGALYFLEIEGVGALRERFGYAVLEQLLGDAGRGVRELAGEHPAARINDNSFLVLADTLEAGRHVEFARSLRDGLSRQPFAVGAQVVRLRALIGHAPCDGGFEDAGAALAAAERALREARTQPTGIAGYEPQVVDDPARAVGKVQELHQALAEQRFELAYQPIVAVAGGEDAQYQTLVRLRGEDGTLRTAADILPVAEAADLLHEIDWLVARKALDTLQSRHREGKPLRLFVSQSPRSLMRDGYADGLRAAVKDSGIEGQSLVIDVRLDDALIHAVALQEFGASIVPTGIQLCLSQYRSGPESDGLLARLPLGFVRLSARYSSGLGESATRDEMRGAIDRAHRLGLQVIGQQVEDPQAAATLWISGIDYIQGNLVQRATDEMDFDFQHSVL